MATLVSGSALAQSTIAVEQQQGMIAGICLGQLALGEEACGCLAERAMTGLDDAQRDYLLLTVVNPPLAESSPIATSQAELAAIFTFLEEASAACTAAATPAPAPDESNDAGEAGQN